MKNELRLLLEKLEKLERMTDPEEIYKNPESASIPEDDNIRFALINRLVQNVSKDRWSVIFKWSERLEKAERLLLVMQVMKKAKVGRGYDFIFNQEVIEWLNGKEVKELMEGI